MQEMQENEDNNLAQDDFDLNSVFNNREDNVIEPKPTEQDKKEPVKKAEPVKEAQEEAEDDDEDEVEDKDQKKEESHKEFDYKAELEKLQKSKKDTEKSYHEGQKKLAAYKKAVEKLKEEGSLLEEEASLLLDHTRHEEVAEEVPLLTKYFNIWDKEIEDMRKVYEKGYIEKPQEFDQHILAFQHFIRTASPHELDDALDDLSKFENNPVALTKQMLEMGRQYNEDIYSDIHESGGIRKLKSMYSKREEKLKNRIDKLEKEVDKYKKRYEDHDDSAPNYGALSGGRGDVNIDENTTFDIKNLLGR